MINGKIINLRTIRQEDIDEIYTLKRDISQRGEYLNVNLTSEPMFKKKFQETGYWNDDFGTMVITDKNDSLIGEITYFKGVSYLPGYEIGCRIYRDEDKRKGYATEALRIFTSYLFELKDIKRLEVHLIKGNIASRKIAEKCGFVYEGLKRQAVFSRGKYEDIELLSLLREECP